ncbi:hypothetical protein MTBPR1_60119 [Candidatus Terasakiella magnetica]|uniref:Uncharacterized protein n=1 Tax=Candidatus Terasakiella magnetica TaxID=1867952 RepID=A0A1C3RK14_9PROT|nr:hypothetical protein MTBPR1_60119 [Candidatus Terasakiella magnetica]
MGRAAKPANKTGDKGAMGPLESEAMRKETSFMIFVNWQNF